MEYAPWTLINGTGFNVPAILTHLREVRHETLDPDLRTVILLGEQLIEALMAERASDTTTAP